MTARVLNRMGFTVPMAFALSLAYPTLSYGLPVLSQVTFGGAGDETGTGVATNSTGVYFSGYTATGEAIIGEFAPNLASPPGWTRTWPNAGNWDAFNDVAATSSSVYGAGSSYSQTVDTVGDKEMKGITVSFNADGSNGGGTAGAVWARQTPAAPGGFPYGGIEQLTGISTTTESGQNYLYTAGVGERVGFTLLFGTFVTKLDEAGNVLWSRNDMTPTYYTNEAAVAGDGNGVYLATRNDSSGAHPYLRNFSATGALDWSRTSAVSGEYLGIAVSGDEVVAVGQSFVGTGNSDFLIEKWDDDGNLLWSRTFDRNLAADVLHDVVIVGGHIYAVGSTGGGTAGGLDGILLDIDLLTGDLLDFTLWGGAADDILKGLSILDDQLFAVGSTRSFGAGGNDITLVSFTLPRQQAPEPGSLVLVVMGLLGLAGERLSHKKVKG